VALHREEEFKLHVRPALRNGVTIEELRSLLLQTALSREPERGHKSPDSGFIQAAAVACCHAWAASALKVRRVRREMRRR
jgi:hypothetical protein